ncbi:MAG: nuclear transport factor 2 family protein [Flavobacterium sp.]
MINVLGLFILFLNREAIAHKTEECTKTESMKTDILQMDQLLYDVAFNECDAALFKKIIAEDVEFYDDRFGLNKPEGKQIKSLVEKFDTTGKLTRELISCTIDKLGDFGAVQTGEHTFFINGVPESTGKFVHLWERKDNNWKLKRIVSYEHRVIKSIIQI